MAFPSPSHNDSNTGQGFFQDFRQEGGKCGDHGIKRGQETIVVFFMVFVIEGMFQHTLNKGVWGHCSPRKMLILPTSETSSGGF